MSTSKLFRKHFGDIASVSLNNPNIENFFEELKEECLLEDKQRDCEHSWVYKILFDHTGKNICEKCHLLKDQ